MIEISSPTAARQRGFTIAELMISLFVTLIVMLAVLSMFDVANKVSRVQTNVADMQQSLRIAQDDLVRLARMAGRGGMPVGNLPDGMAVAVRNNVVDGTLIGGVGSPAVLAESDVLTVRGVFSTPLYQLNPADPNSFQLFPAVGVPVRGVIRIASRTTTGITQDLSALKDAIGDGSPAHPGRREGLLIGSPTTDTVNTVVELDPSTSDVTNPDLYVIGFKITGGINTAGYLKFSSDGPGTYPATLTRALFVGILEEYRFYVRQDFAIGGDKTSDLTSKLSRARVYPGTDNPWAADAANLREDVADNIVDFQVALGLDTANGGCSLAVSETTCSLAETADGVTDDWMFNGEAADPAFVGASLQYIRLDTLARTDRRDIQFTAPQLVRIEDHAFTAASRLNTTRDRMFRRRVLRTWIDLRNI